MCLVEPLHSRERKGERSHKLRVGEPPAGLIADVEGFTKDRQASANCWRSTNNLPSRNCPTMVQNGAAALVADSMMLEIAVSAAAKSPVIGAIRPIPYKTPRHIVRW